MDVTWRIRPGIKWHDGVPFTSADIKFTVEAINSPDYNPESTDGFDRIESVETPDSLTAVVRYREVYAPYALQFIRGALPRHVLAGRDIDGAPGVVPSTDGLDGSHEWARDRAKPCLRVPRAARGAYRRATRPAEGTHCRRRRVLAPACGPK